MFNARGCYPRCKISSTSVRFVKRAVTNISDILKRTFCLRNSAPACCLTDGCVTIRGVTRLGGAWDEKQVWRPPPMFEPEVFRKQKYFIEESACDIVETSATGELCPPCSPLVTPLVTMLSDSQGFELSDIALTLYFVTMGRESNDGSTCSMLLLRMFLEQSFCFQKNIRWTTLLCWHLTRTTSRNCIAHRWSYPYAYGKAFYCGVGKNLHWK